MEFFPNVKVTDRLYPWPEAGKTHWIDVKRQLTAREEQDIRSAGVPHMMGKAADSELTDEQRKELEVKMGLNMGRMKLVRAAAYIVHWSVARGDSPVIVNEHTIGELLPDVFDAIDKALDKHKEAVDASKKAQPETSTSDTSTPVSASVGS